MRERFLAWEYPLLFGSRYGFQTLSRRLGEKTGVHNFGQTKICAVLASIFLVLAMHDNFTLLVGPVWSMIIALFVGCSVGVFAWVAVGDVVMPMKTDNHEYNSYWYTAWTLRLYVLVGLPLLGIVTGVSWWGICAWFFALCTTYLVCCQPPRWTLDLKPRLVARDGKHI